MVYCELQHKRAKHWRLKTEGGSSRKYPKMRVKDSSQSVRAYVNRPLLSSTTQPHCFFVEINENEPASMIGSKLNPLFCDDEWVQMGRLRNDA